MYLLDSSAIIELLHGTKSGEEIMKFIDNNPVCTTSINLYEVLIGENEKEREKISQFFSSVEILDFDENAARFSVEIEKKLIHSGKAINKIDILIAGICKSNNKILISLDNDFKRIESIKSAIFKPK